MPLEGLKTALEALVFFEGMPTRVEGLKGLKTGKRKPALGGLKVRVEGFNVSLAEVCTDTQ